MEVASLYLFAEVIRLRSFTAIAKARGIAPSSVSRTIRALEKEVGIRLFHRTTRQIVPTEAGLRYFERISSVLEELELAQLLASDHDSLPKGTLKITAPRVFGELYLIPLLPKFNQLYPDLTLEILLNDEFTNLVEEGIDVAIRAGMLQDSSYIARKLISMNFFITASPKYLARMGTPSLPEHISQHNCLVFPRVGHNSNWLFKANNEVQEVNVQAKILVTQSSAIKQLAVANMGLSLLPDWLVSREIESGELIHLFSDWQVTATNYSSAVWLLYPSREYLPLKVKVFNDFLLTHFSQHTYQAH